MTRESKDAPVGGTETSPEVPPTTPALPGNSWRDRLHKDKLAAQGGGPVSAPGNRPNENIRNRFQNTAPGATAQKTRKGSRPG